MGMVDDKRLWKCPECSNTEPRHHAKRTRPFCDPCDSRHAVLIEMKPIGPGREHFYDDEGNAINA